MLEVLRSIGYPVIVEGKRDKEKLSEMEIKNVIPLNGKSLYNFTFNISQKYDEVLILTDFDKEGRKLSGRITSLFQSMGVRTHGKLRKEIMKRVTKNGKSMIENLQICDLKED
ncbi:MAG: toprim domain-containing protein [Candidatus Aenigmatarchaeota archaeon]